MLKNNFKEIIETEISKTIEINKKEREQLNEIIKILREHPNSIAFQETSSGIEVKIAATNTSLGHFTTIHIHDIYKHKNNSSKKMKREIVYKEVLDMLENNKEMNIKQAVFEVRNKSFPDMSQKSLETYFFEEKREQKLKEIK